MNVPKIPTTQTQRFVILDAIVAELGGTVTKRATAGDHYVCWLTFTTDSNETNEDVGISLYYHDDRKGDYIHASGDWPRDSEGHMIDGRSAGKTNPDIRFSATKTAAVQGMDIRRRLMPDLAPAYAAAKAIVASRNNYKADTLGNYRLLAEAGGGKTVENAYNRGVRITGLPDYITIQNVNDRDARIELTLTIAEACALLKGMTGKPL